MSSTMQNVKKKSTQTPKIHRKLETRKQDLFWFRQRGRSSSVCAPAWAGHHLCFQLKPNLPFEDVNCRPRQWGVPQPPMLHTLQNANVHLVSIRPFVQIIVSGPEADPSQQTKAANHGFHPMWEDRFTFAVKAPELSTLTLRVGDATSKLDIAEASAPLDSLQSGHRAVGLVSIADGVPLPYSTLFCRFAIVAAKQQ
eukprot:NODE_2624_length_891_cov_111.143705_g2160_i0.p1 GENE.NODE_2624_length_891_cov_111.143705_g2160_i0~~NODE_2624_length_891_cov_111.143705_g2160_i0.p1  ORF type:complete len:197 (-),score=11.09 NODE_2624_length_891_cov_111.143705_g2160_i0:46-636(-)